MDACVGLVREHRDWIEGLQDCGAAGLTSAAVEMAERADAGIIIHTERVPRRERGMTAYEVMLSESQERMVVSVKPEHAADAAVWFAQWELDAAVIGEVTSDGLARVMEGGREVAAAPVSMLTNAPSYEPPARRDPAAAARAAFDPAALPDLDPADANAALLELLASPNIASKRWVYRQYDHQVGTNTVVTPGADAAVLRIRGVQHGLAVCTDGPRPRRRARPMGGSRARRRRGRAQRRLHWRPPDRRHRLSQLRQPRAARDLLPAARVDPRHRRRLPRLRCPRRQRERIALQRVRSGPGAADAGDRHARPARAPRDRGALRLSARGRRRHPARCGARAAAASLGASEYLALRRGLCAGPVHVDLAAERALVDCLAAAAEAELLRSAHDCSEGGLAVALAESAIGGALGVRVGGGLGERLDAALFGEAGARAVVSAAPAATAALRTLAERCGVPLTPLGRVGGDRLVIADAVDLPLQTLTETWEAALPQALG